MNMVVETTAGKIEGWEKDGIKIFQGVPFAAPPAGELRWLPPQPVKPWDGIREARSFVAIAPQIVPPRNSDNPLHIGFNIDTSLGRQPGPDEDCLYLNVYTPGTDHKRRPVMVWIHGGGFASGTGASPLYNGTLLGKRGDVVVVTVNYRLNVFGFLRLKDVTNGRIPSEGVEGMLDQVAALKWVRENIEVFGGDPDNITIFGESAGGASVTNLMAMPLAKGLFHKAICQSGSAYSVSPVDRANIYTEHFLHKLAVDADDTDGLLGKSMEEIVKAYAKTMSLSGGLGAPLTVLDGTVIPELPVNAIARGSADGIPLLAGTMLQEWRLWQAFDPSLEKLGESHMLSRFKKMTNSWDMTEIVAAYKKLIISRGILPTPKETYLTIMSARMYRIPVTRMLEAHYKRQNPAYCYLITWKSPFKDGIYGSCHALDIGLLWGAYKSPLYGNSPNVEIMANKIQDSWLAFAYTGKPSNESAGEWPVYGEQRKTMVFDEKTELQEAPKDEERCIWDDAPDSVFVRG